MTRASGSVVEIVVGSLKVLVAFSVDYSHVMGVISTGRRTYNIDRGAPFALRGLFFEGQRESALPRGMHIGNPFCAWMLGLSVSAAQRGFAVYGRPYLPTGSLITQSTPPDPVASPLILKWPVEISIFVTKP
jgi:hypothetical protein